MSGSPGGLVGDGAGRRVGLGVGRDGDRDASVGESDGNCESDGIGVGGAVVGRVVMGFTASAAGEGSPSFVKK